MQRIFQGKKSNEIYINLNHLLVKKRRLVIAGPNCLNQRLSSLVENILTTLVPKLISYIKDDWDFLKKLRRNLGPNFTHLKREMVSLCMNILHKLGLRALVYYITKYRNLIPIIFRKRFILEAAKFVLQNHNFFLFGEMFNQVMGTKMGFKLAPPCANVSVGFLEETVLFPVELFS